MPNLTAWEPNPDCSAIHVRKDPTTGETVSEVVPLQPFWPLWQLEYAWGFQGQQGVADTEGEAKDQADSAAKQAGYTLA